MSEARVLTTKQQRKALSNAKKKKKAPVRNVYGHPRRQNWPVLTADDERFVLSHLQKMLSCKVDQATGKGTSARQLASISSKNLETSTQIESMRNQLVVGLRKVIVDIEKGNLKGLLLAQEVDPPSLGYLVGNLAEAHNVPFAAVANLKSCIEEQFGFKSWCLGLKTSSKDFDLICDKVKTASENHEEVGFQHKTSINVGDTKQNTKLCPSTRRVKNISDLHLFRANRSKRVFIPKTATSADNLESSFLSFSKDTSGDTMCEKIVPSKSGTSSAVIRKLSLSSSKPSQSPRYFDKVQLLPLQVKRFKENPNKQKWKKSNNRSLENGQQ